MHCTVPAIRLNDASCFQYLVQAYTNTSLQGKSPRVSEPRRLLASDDELLLCYSTQKEVDSDRIPLNAVDDAILLRILQNSGFDLWEHKPCHGTEDRKKRH
nr:hypothetical protein CFP56_10186 [Quercus suber]